MTSELDVVIVGGGVQGLLALDTLVDRGYACALVTDGELGAGQTLHSHGFLATGFGMFGDQLQRASADIAQPYLRGHGIEPTGEWLLIPPPGFPGIETLPAGALPEGFGDIPGAKIVRTPDRNFPKQPLVEMLGRERRDHILRGRVTFTERAQAVRTIRVRLTTGEEVSLETKAMIIAAGCGSKAILESLVGQTPQIDQIKHRRVHMICVRAPRGAVPAVSVAALPLGLMLVAHEQPSRVTWYVTPMEFGGPSYDDIPHDAASDTDPAAVDRGFQALLKLYPALLEVEDLRLGCYAGYRQDIGDQPGVPMCELVQGTTNVIIALPSGIVASWLNAARITQIVSELIDPSGSQPRLSGGGIGVEVGSVVEDRPDFAWLTRAEWMQRMSFRS